jgi:gamma-glutamyltranspeptidase / glutathione hydrolase
MRIPTFLSSLLLLRAVSALPNPDLVTHKGETGAVASESSVCSKIGIDMLKLGGNAADALTATVFCVGVIGMYHSGQVVSGHISRLY